MGDLFKLESVSSVFFQNRCTHLSLRDSKQEMIDKEEKAFERCNELYGLIAVVGGSQIRCFLNEFTQVNRGWMQ